LAGGQRDASAQAGVLLMQSTIRSCTHSSSPHCVGQATNGAAWPRAVTSLSAGVHLNVFNNS
jgi:hypothetical protein